MYLVMTAGNLTPPYLAYSTRPSSVTVQVGPMMSVSNSLGTRKAARAFSYSPSHMAASLPWPMSRMR